MNNAKRIKDKALQSEYVSKLRTTREAVSMIKNGDTIYAGTCSSIAYALLEALAELRNRPEDITIACTLVVNPVRVFEDKKPKGLKICTFFMGPQERKCMRSTDIQTDFTSVHLSQVDIWCRETVHPDVVLFEVSPPDEEGYMSYGATGVAVNTYLKESARTVILQVNNKTPYVYGELNKIHISSADVIVEAEHYLQEVPNIPIDDAITTISEYVLEQIPDGACIQLGIGGVSNAVGFGLRSKNDLGVHTEMMTDSIMTLMQMGVVNNSRKSFVPDKTTASFTFGTEKLYDFVNYNKDMYYMPYPIVCNPVNIAKNDNMISVNTAISIDLFGQVNADNIAGRQHSATGGQLDFVRGAQMSKGGKSFITIPSVVDNAKLGRQSRIVSRFPMGTAITTPRSDVQYVVTEYGCVNLKPLTMRSRIKAMIDLAHPDYRPSLIEEAKSAGML